MLKICRCGRPIGKLRPSTAALVDLVFTKRFYSSSNNKNTSKKIADGSKFYKRMENQIRIERGYAPLHLGQYDNRKKERIIMKDHVKGVINWLNQLTNNEQMQLPENSTENRLYKKPKAKSNQIPKYPSYWSQQELKNYVNLLTNNEYTTDELRRLCKIILKDILLMNGRLIGDHEVYNNAIKFLLKMNDVQGALEVAQQMDQYIGRDLESYKLFLLSIRRKWDGNKFFQNPIRTINNLLKEIHERGIKIDAEVWNIVLISMPDVDSRISVLRQMGAKKIPLSRRGHTEVFQNIVEVLDIDFSINFLINQPHANITIESVNQIVYKLMQKDTTKDRLRAWKWLHLALTKWELTPTTATLNMILETMVSRQRLDWMFGVLGNLSTTYNLECRPDSRTYRLLFQAALARSYHSNKHHVLNLIYSMWEHDFPNDTKREYFKRYAVLQAEFNQKMGQSSTKLELTGDYSEGLQKEWDIYINTLKWGNTNPTMHFKKNKKKTEKNKNKNNSKKAQFASFLLGFKVENLHPAYKHGPFKFYRQPYLSKWHEFKESKLEQQQLAFKNLEMENRRNIVNTGAMNKYISDLVKYSIIEDE